LSSVVHAFIDRRSVPHMAEAEALLSALRAALGNGDAEGILTSEAARAAITGADGVPNPLEGVVGEVEAGGSVAVADILAFVQERMGGPSEAAAMEAEPRLDPQIFAAYAAARRAPEFYSESLAGPEVASGELTERVLEFVSAPDGNRIKALFLAPAAEPGESPAPLPTVVYFHGGGMASGSAFEPQHRNWGRCLALEARVAVVMVDFRNYVNASRANPQETKAFPAGLNDCVSGLEWVHAHATELGVDPARVMLAGESGGGNLALATAMRCLREARLHLFSCWFVVAPMIAGCYPKPDCPSAALFEGLPPGATCKVGSTASVDGYAGAAAFADPLAWPYAAGEANVSGLPRGAVWVNELDPLRDEGLAFFATCLRAGVDVSSVTLAGTTHCANVLPGVLPAACAETARAMRFLLDGSPKLPSL